MPQLKIRCLLKPLFGDKVVNKSYTSKQFTVLMRVFE